MPLRRVAAELGAVGPATLWADAELVASGAPDALRNAVGVCVEEAIANLILHGAAAGGDKAIVLELEAGADRARVEITDSCLPFDIARATLAGPPGRDDMRVGGQGLRLLRGFASTLDYRSSAGRNILTLTFDAASMDDRS